MKNQRGIRFKMNIQYCLALLLFLSVSCQKEEHKPNTNNSLMYTEENAKAVEQWLAKRGFRKEDVIDNGDHFLVEGDMIFPKSSIVFDLDNASGRVDQNVVSRSPLPFSQQRIKVVIDSSVPTEFHHDIERGMSIWNQIQGCNINFTFESPDISAPVIQIVAGGTSGIANANGCISQVPGNKICLNLAKYSVLDANARFKIMSHMLGHTIGFAHTDMSGILVPGTPTNDPQSVMNSALGDSGWPGLTTSDRIAARTVFPQTILYGLLANTEHANVIAVDIKGNPANKANNILINQTDWIPDAAAAGNNAIFSVDGVIYYTNPKTGVSTLSPNPARFGEVSVMTVLDNVIYLIDTSVDNGTLFKVNPWDASEPVPLSYDWNGSTAMTSGDGVLYIIQDNYIYQVDPSNGQWTPLVQTGVEPTRSIVSNGQKVLIWEADGYIKSYNIDIEYLQTSAQEWQNLENITLSGGNIYWTLSAKNKYHESGLYINYRYAGGGGWAFMAKALLPFVW